MEKSTKFVKRQINHQCPICLSTLLLIDNDYVCSGDQLVYWKKEFKRFAQMNKKEQQDYIEDLSDKDKFFDMYSQGDDLNCEFSTKIINILPSSSEKIADPIIVSRLEKSLRRPLTDEELENVPKINFPDDV